MKKNLQYFTLTGILSWIIGCLPMIIMWYVYGKEYCASIPGCMGYWDFLAVKYGDMICLPLLNAGLFCSCKNCITSADVEKKTLAAGCLGGCAGLLIQCSWLFPLKDEFYQPGNWTFGPDGLFNSAGWYHAFFFISELAFLSFMFVADWMSGAMQRKPVNEEIFRLIALISGSVFLILHNLDDYGNHGSGKVILVTLLLTVLLSTAFYSSQIICRSRNLN